LQSQICTNYPFGDGQICSGPDVTEHHFTGKERDTETGLDYFGARYYGSGFSRFMTPDWAAKAVTVPYANLDNPQTLNLYAYMTNNPLSGVDADGHLGCNGSTEGFCNPAVQENMRKGMDSFSALGAAQNSGGAQGAAQQQNDSGWTSTRPTSGDYVTVSDYSKSAKGFHHVGIGVNSDDTQGFSTLNPKTPWWQRIFGAPKARMENDLQMHTSPDGEVAPHSYLYHSITSGQADAIRRAMNARRVDAGRYNLIFRNCAQAVESFLHAGGVSGVPHGEILVPAVLHDVLLLERGSQ
jgi:RHS repeat-associated protein